MMYLTIFALFLAILITITAWAFLTTTRRQRELRASEFAVWCRKYYFGMRDDSSSISSHNNRRKKAT